MQATATASEADLSEGAQILADRADRAMAGMRACDRSITKHSISSPPKRICQRVGCQSMKPLRSSARSRRRTSPGSIHERAVRTSCAALPATVHGLRDRSFLRTGAWADVVVFDPATVAARDSYLARDFPAHTERYVVDARGYRGVIVNGVILVEDGKHTGALPGHVLRGA
jgi:N-acyl-D-aspartate/D-glutamate deacylase